MTPNKRYARSPVAEAPRLAATTRPRRNPGNPPAAAQERAGTTSFHLLRNSKKIRNKILIRTIYQD
jgi:hypothetical protein